MDRSISEQELAMCRLFGNTADEYIKTREHDKATALNRDGLNYRGPITEQELAICRQMGVSRKDYLKTRQETADIAMDRNSMQRTPSTMAQRTHNNETSSPAFSVSMAIPQTARNI